MGLGIEEKVTGEPGTKGMCVAGEVNNIVATLDAAIGGGSGVDCLKLALEAAAKPTLVFNNISGTSYRADTLVALHGGVNDLSSLKGKELMTIGVKSPFPIGDAKEGVCEIDSILFSGDTNITLTSTNVYTLNEGRNIFLLDFDNDSFEVIDNTDIRLNPNIDSLSLIDGLNINVFVDDNGKEYVDILNTSGITIVPENIIVDGNNTSAGIYSDTDGVKRKVRTDNENILLGNGDVNDNASMSVITIPDTMLDTNGNAMGPSEGRELTIDGMTLLFTKTLIYIKEADGVYQFIGDENGYEYNNIASVINYDFDATVTGINIGIKFIGDKLLVNKAGVETEYIGNDNNEVTVSIADGVDTSVKGLNVSRVKFTNVITSIHIEKNDLQTDATEMFKGLTYLTTFTANPNSFGSVTNMDNAWYYCDSLIEFPLIDTSSVTDMTHAWNGCGNLTSFPAIDTSSVTDMYSAWYSCGNLTSFPLLDTSSVTNMAYTWYFCAGLTSFPLLDTSSVTNMYLTWSDCNSLTSFPLIDTSSVTNMDYTWSDCNSLTSFPLIDISNVIDMYGTWSGCISLICMGGFTNNGVAPTFSSESFSDTPLLQRPTAVEQASILAGNTWINDVPCNDPSYIYDFIANFTKTTTSTANGLSFTGTSIELTDEDTGTVTTHTDDTVDIPLSASTTWSIKGKGVTKFRFKYTSINSIHIEENDLQTDAADMFRALTSLTTFTANPNTFGSVTNMSYTWYYCTALTSFPLIDTSNVTDMSNTWYNCTGLTSFPLIDTSNVTDMSNTWYNCRALISFPLIDISSVTDTDRAWKNCTSLICMEGFTNNGVAPTSKTDVFYNTPALLAPNATEQTSILAGNTWTNPNAC